jgi:hypothetical protein
MKIKFLIFALTALTLVACNFSESVNMDLSTGLTTRGHTLSSSEVYITVDEKRVSSSTFIYGETFYLNFQDVKGFVKKDGNVFPGMEIYIIGEEGDTALQNNDMYADKVNGVNISPLFLYSNITVAKPMMSGKKYELHVKIWDKKGEGTFTAAYNFDIVPNDKIVIDNPNKLGYDNIYLFSEKGSTITNNKASYGEKIYMIFEGLSGFKTEAGKVSVGMGLKGTDANGNIVIEEKDLIGDGEWTEEELNKQIAANVVFTDNTIVSPVKCDILVWDKKGDVKITATANIELE